VQNQGPPGHHRTNSAPQPPPPPPVQPKPTPVVVEQPKPPVQPLIRESLRESNYTAAVLPRGSVRPAIVMNSKTPLSDIHCEMFSMLIQISIDV